ncbi:MAG: hypothetical protein ABW173_06140 [Sphingomonas sp.]
MANEMPPSDEYTGLSRTVLRYSESFARVIAKVKDGTLSDSDWQTFETLVDPATFERIGVFLGAKAEVIDWTKYKEYIASYGGATDWEGTLRHITEVPGRVFLELEERNTRNGETDTSNTVTIYDFDDAGRIRHLDVYVMPLR